MALLWEKEPPVPLIPNPYPGAGKPLGFREEAFAGFFWEVAPL